MSKWNDLVAKMANDEELPSSMLALPGLDARADGSTVSVTLTAQDLDEITDALHRASDAYADDGDEELAGAAKYIDDVLLPKLKIARAALP